MPFNAVQWWLNTIKQSPVVKIWEWLTPPAGIDDQAAIWLEEERLRDEAERARQRKKTAPPGSQSLPKPVPTGPIPKPPTAPPLTPVEPDDYFLPIPPTKAKAKEVGTSAPYPSPPQKPIWEDPIEAFRKWVFPGATAGYVNLGVLLRYNYLKGDTTLYRWQGITNPPDFFNQSKLSYSNFLAWLAKKTGVASAELGDLGGQVDQFWDQSATIWFNNAGQLDGMKGIIYGVEPLGIIFQDYWVGSRTAQFGGVRGMLYQAITVENYPAPWSRDLNNNLEELDSQSGEGLASGLANYLIASKNLVEWEEDNEPRVILENTHMKGEGVFPLKVPASFLIEKSDLEGMSPEEIEKKAFFKAKNYGQLVNWWARAFKEVLGQFPLSFKIQESEYLDLEDEFKAWEKTKDTKNPNLPFYLQNDKMLSFEKVDGKLVKTVKIKSLAEALSRLSQALRGDLFPLSLPVSLLIEQEDIAKMSDKEIESKVYTKIQSFPELFLWWVRIFDEIMGKFPLKFEISESETLDLKPEFEAWKKAPKPKPDEELPFYLQNDKLISFEEKGGKITKRIKVPNLAEAISELTAGSISQDQQVALINEVVFRCLAESAAMRTTGIKTHYLLESVWEFLGFAAKEVPIDVEFSWDPTIDPEKEEYNLKTILKESVQKIPVWDFQDKYGFQMYLNRLLTMYSVIMAVHTEGVGKSDLAFFQRLKSYADGFDPDPEIVQPLDPISDPPPKTRFDDFLEEVERGFTQTAPGITDKDNPYGKPPKNRPKIKRVGKKGV